MNAASQGFFMGGSLIVAIGAQNAFVLTRGVRRNFPLLVAAICFVCDALLLTLGVTGVGRGVAASPDLGRVAAAGGALFLGWYGWKAFRSVLRPETLTTENDGLLTMKQAVTLCLGVTLLNPHVYLDTVVLMGSVSGQFAAAERWHFLAGAMGASLVWFFGLALGGVALAPVFARPGTWRILDGLVCLTMWSIGFTMARTALGI